MLAAQPAADGRERFRGAAIAAGWDGIIVPALPGDDLIDRLRSELAAIRVCGTGVPLYHLCQLRRGTVAAALGRVARATRATRDGQIPLSSQIDATGVPLLHADGGIGRQRVRRRPVLTRATY